jgi:DNA topoisomerase IA
MQTLSRNKNFTVKKYWQIQFAHKAQVDFKSISATKWDEKQLADDTLKAIQRSATATVTSVETKSVTEQPPLLFDLTGLQKEANKRLKLSAEATLNIAQSLYEKSLSRTHVPEANTYLKICGQKFPTLCGHCRTVKIANKPLPKSNGDGSINVS